MHTVTALGNLYKKSFIVSNGIRFDDKMLHYCDMAFIVSVLNLARVVNGDKEAEYIKRFHNDPIQSFYTIFLQRLCLQSVRMMKRYGVRRGFRL